MLTTLLALAALTLPPGNGGTITRSLPQGAHLSLAATASGCENNPGPYITIDGALTLSGVAARIILTNNRRFTHVTEADVTADVEIVPVGQEIRIHKQPVLGGVGGNPWFYLQFSDGERLLGKPKLIGRCVQGLNPVALDFDLPTTAHATVDSDACSNSGGPTITLNGELKLGGFYGHLILTNNARFTHVTSADVVINIVIVPAGQSIVFAKQPPLDGAGGNPYIFLQFLDGSQSALGDPIFVGRCNQL
ncbi:MAG TPA: hypothetical protein VF530_10025 [Planctomycetota bacterium]